MANIPLGKRMRDAVSNLTSNISRAFSPQQEKKRDAKAFFYGSNMSNLQVFGINYNGEKNLGEMGAIKVYMLDYDALRLRSWQLYLESDIVKAIVGKLTLGVIGSGMKLQANPHMEVLRAEGIKFDAEDFNDTIEAYFENFCKSKSADWNGQQNLRQMMATCYTNKTVAGDVLVVLRVTKNNDVKVQLIDAAHVWNPIMGNDSFAFQVPPGQPGEGNIIRNGIEYDDSGETIAFYVRTANKAAGSSYYTGTYERVLAKNSLGMTMAYMVSGLEYRIDNKRGIPLFSSVMETVKKMERYKEAMVGTAEEQAKIAYQIVHEIFSDGSNPNVTALATIRNAGAQVDDNPEDINGKELASKVIASTNKQTFNMPKGAQIKPFNATNGTLYFKDFNEANFDLICAAVNMPPEVAKSQYDSNYSASRAAIKDWQHTIQVNRIDFGFQFLQPIYELFFHMLVLQNKIQAPGYLKAFYTKDTTIVDAYRHAHWIGSAVAEIDPYKAAMAARLRLGSTSDAIPLTTVEKELEEMGTMSDVPAIIKQYKKELKLVKKNKIKPPKWDKNRVEGNGNNGEEDKIDAMAMVRAAMREELALMKEEADLD